MLCVLAAGLFGAPYKLTMTPDLFENPFPDIASNEGGSLPGVEPDELPDQ